MEWKDIAGYLAMTLLIISVVPKQLKTVRIINLLASTFFVIYGFLFVPYAWPIIISNFAVCCIQIYHLFFAKKIKAE